jgi:hypothetical protein
MVIRTPLTTEVRAAYAGSHDYFYIEQGESGQPPAPTNYAERALGFDQWLNATIAIAKAQGVAEGIVTAVSDIATGESLKPQDPSVVTFDIWLMKCIEKIMAEELAKGNTVSPKEALAILSKRMIV